MIRWTPSTRGLLVALVRTALPYVLVALGLLGLGMLLAAGTARATTPQADPLLDAALHHCPRYAKAATLPPEATVRRLFALEAALGMPAAGRGLVAATACWESAYKNEGRCGDQGRSCGIMQLHHSWKADVAAALATMETCPTLDAWKVKAARDLRAKGLGAWTARKLADDPRRCLPAAVQVYVERVLRQMPRVKKHCKGQGGFESLEAFYVASAELTAVRRPPCVEYDARGRCSRRSRKPLCAVAGRYVSRHWKVLETWRTK